MRTAKTRAAAFGKRSLAFGVVLFFAGCATVGYATAGCATNEGTLPDDTSVAPPEETTEPPATVPQPEDDEAEELRVGLERISTESGVEVGVAVEEVGRGSGGVEAGVREDAVFPSASLIKVLVLVEVLRRADEGSLTLDEPLGGSTVGALAQAMISSSDNAAANLLIGRVGFESVNALARDLDLEQTRLGREMLDFEARARGEDNFTSASDMVALLSEIWEGDLLSPSSREFALTVLERQSFDSKMPAALPPEARVFHKTGELENIEHDAGIVVLPNGRAFAMAVLTSGEEEAGIEAIRRSATLSYAFFAA